MKPGYQKVRRMTGAMRIIHWVNAISIVAAVITGLYIGHVITSYSIHYTKLYENEKVCVAPCCTEMLRSARQSPLLHVKKQPVVGSAAALS